jgi:CRP-like cAMP-binding protein
MKNTPEMNFQLKRRISMKSSKTYAPLESQNKNYNIVNELSVSDYFGEISVLKDSLVTASIHVISHTICCEITQKDFSDFVENYSDCKQKLEAKIHTYMDSYFKDLHRLI